MRYGIPAIAAALFWCMARAWALAPVPAPTGHLVDQTGIIEPEVAVEVQARLAQYQAASGRALAVLLVPSTPDEDLETYADRVVAAWALDQAPNGAALLLWSADGYILIRAVGPALDALGGAPQSQILSRWVVPAFAEGEAGRGIRDGVERMIVVLDGGDVGFPGPSPRPQPPQADLALDPAERGPPAAPSGDSLPALFASLPAELDRLGQGFAGGLDAGMGAWFAEAARDARAVPVIVRALLLQAGGERVEPPFAPERVAALYVVAGVALIGMVMLVRGALVAAVLWLGTVGGAAFWVATGTTALAGTVMALGLAAPVLVPLIQAALRGADTSERQSEPPRRLPPKRPASAMPTASRPAPVQRPTPMQARSQDSAIDAVRQRITRMQPQVRQLRTLAMTERRKLGWRHAAGGLFLLAVAPGLALAGIAGLILFRLYRSGMAYLLADLLVTDPALRVRLQARLPRPPGA